MRTKRDCGGLQSGFSVGDGNSRQDGDAWPHPKRDEKRQPQIAVCITEHGSALAKEVEAAFSRADERAVRGLSGEVQEELMRLLDLVNHNFLESSEG